MEHVGELDYPDREEIELVHVLQALGDPTPVTEREPMLPVTLSFKATTIPEPVSPSLMSATAISLP